MNKISIFTIKDLVNVKRVDNYIPQKQFIKDNEIVEYINFWINKKPANWTVNAPKSQYSKYSINIIFSQPEKNLDATISFRYDVPYSETKRTVKLYLRKQNVKEYHNTKFLSPSDLKKLLIMFFKGDYVPIKHKTFINYEETKELIDVFMIKSGIRAYCRKVCKGKCCKETTSCTCTSLKEKRCCNKNLACAAYISTDYHKYCFLRSKITDMWKINRPTILINRTIFIYCLSDVIYYTACHFKNKCGDGYNEVYGVPDSKKFQEAFKLRYAELKFLDNPFYQRHIKREIEKIM
jgi:hypothetical protein